MSELRTADLRTHLVLQTKRVAPGQAGGQKILGWDDEAHPTHAKMEIVRSGEALVSGAQRATTLWRITIRFRTGITTGNRFSWSGGLLDIKSVGDPTGKRRELFILAETAVD